MFLKSRHLSLGFLLLFSLNVSSLLASAQTANKQRLQSNEFETLYLKGKALLENQSYREALRTFYLLNFRYPTHPYLEQVQLNIITCLGERECFIEATKAADDFIENYPGSDQLNYIKKYKHILQDKQRVHRWKNVLFGATVGVCAVGFAYFDLKYGLLSAFFGLCQYGEEFNLSMKGCKSEYERSQKWAQGYCSTR